MIGSILGIIDDGVAVFGFRAAIIIVTENPEIQFFSAWLDPADFMSFGTVGSGGQAARKAGDE
jgi:hypothetical protein